MSASQSARAFGDFEHTHHQAPASEASDRWRHETSQSFSDSNAFRSSSLSADVDDGLSHAVGSLKLAQSRASGPAPSAGGRGADSRRLSLFGVAGAPARRNSNAVLHRQFRLGLHLQRLAPLSLLGLAQLALHRVTRSHARRLGRLPLHRRQRRVALAWFGSGFATRKQRIAQQQHTTGCLMLRSVPLLSATSAWPRPLGQTSTLHPAQMSRKRSEDRSAGITPTQSLVAKPTIRRGHVPAYVREIGQGGIPGDSSSDAKSDSTAAADERAQRPMRSRVDSLTQVTDANAQRKVNKRRSRDISVLPPLLAPISRSGSSTNLYAQMPRSARAYSTGRAWTAANTPQMYVGSAGSSHQQAAGTAAGAGAHMQPPVSPTLVRSPYNSSFALTQDALRAALSPSRPNSAAGYHSLPTTPQALRRAQRALAGEP
ncbi:hypothetical protein L1887_50841 [Cichorium endivia]|nr:hypothetical protein L1887_50841 [Cichorium endivia]